MPRAARKNPSRKVKKFIQKGGATSSEIRDALWTTRHHYNDYFNLLATNTANKIDYVHLVDSSKYNSDWGLPLFASFLDQYGKYSANKTIVDNAWLVSYINLPAENDAIGAIKTQINALYNDCNTKARSLSLAASSIIQYENSMDKTWKSMGEGWSSYYLMYYNASVALIPDAAYNSWKQDGNKNGIPTDDAIANATLSNGLKISLLADIYLTGYNGIARFAVSRVTAYNTYLTELAKSSSVINGAVNDISGNLTKAIALVAQSDTVARQAQMNIFKLTKVIMGYVIYADHSTTVPVIFMTAPPNICIYINTETLLVYTTTRDKVVNSQAMINALNGCLDFNKKYKELKNIDQTIAALPDNSLVKALAFKQTIATKMVNLKVTDIVPPPPPPPPAFTGYGKWVDANARSAASSGQGTITVVDSSGNNFLLNGAVWTIGGVWTITFNGSPRSYFFSNNVKYDVTIIS